jgi:hypothetical protein
MQVIFLRDESITILIDQVEYPADEGVLPAQQTQSPSEFLVIHAGAVLAELVEALGDESLLLFVEADGLGWLEGGGGSAEQLFEALVDDLGLFDLEGRPGLTIIHKQL